MSFGVSKSVECDTFSLQCSDTVGWATERASGLEKAGCWFVGGDDLTGALHILLL